MKLKITKSTVNSIRETAQRTTKRLYVFDTELQGFGLSVTAKGRASYFVEYRMPNKRRLSIGPHGRLTPQEARKEAKSLLGDVAKGIDVARRPRDKITFAEAFEIYIKKNGRDNKSWDETRRILIYDALPAWGQKPISDIKRTDVAQLIDVVSARTPSGARALFAQLRPMFRWCVERGHMEHNSTADLKAPSTSKARDRILTDEEIVQVWKAAEPSWFPFGPIVRLLILTGQRISEVAGMSHDEIEGGTWIIPGARTKNGKQHQVDLHLLTLRILDKLPPANDLLFTTTGRTPPSGFSKAKAKLDANLPALPHWRFHDLRRTCASGMAALGILPNVIERILNHQSGSNAGLVGVYQRHHYRAERRDATLAWGDYVKNLVGDFDG